LVPAEQVDPADLSRREPALQRGDRLPHEGRAGEPRPVGGVAAAARAVRAGGDQNDPAAGAEHAGESVVLAGLPAPLVGGARGATIQELPGVHRGAPRRWPSWRGWGARPPRPAWTGRRTPGKPTATGRVP